MTYPTIRPALTLDFSKTQQLSPRITFSRASDGTYLDSNELIKTAPDGVARFEYDSSGKCLGLLVEEARTNLLTYSEQFDDASWIKANVSITANSTTAPDGTSTADTLNCSSGGQTFQHTRKAATTTAASYTFSCFVKAGNISTIRLGGESYAIYATFDLTGDGSYSSVTTGASASIVSFPNGWYRCTLTYTASAGTYENDIRFSSAALNDYVYIWGAQLEEGSFPTSYIPTAASTVTRSADVASIAGTNFSSWYNQSEGTLFASVRTVTPASVANGFLQFTDGSVNNRIEIYQQNSGDPYPRVGGLYRYLNSTTASFLNQETGWNPDGKTIDNWAFAFNSSGFTFQTKFDATPSTGIGTYPQNLTQVSLGHRGTISRIAYYPERVSDASLEALTL